MPLRDQNFSSIGLIGHRVKFTNVFCSTNGTHYETHSAQQQRGGESQEEAGNSRKAGADSRTNRLHCVATRVLVDIAVERSGR